MWVGALLCIVWAMIAMAVVATSDGWFEIGGSPHAAAAESLTQLSPPGANRTACEEFGNSDLRSPQEGVWFQSNCTGAPASEAATRACNRTSLDPAEFRPLAPGLFAYRQTPASRSYLWYSSSESCFHLVSSRVVASVCADQTVSFSWSTDACSAHGGVLAWVNAR